MENLLRIPQSDGMENLLRIPLSGQQAPIELEVGLRIVDAGVSKLKRILAGADDESFSVKENMDLYTTIYTMCTQRQHYEKQLYEHYKMILQDYAKSIVRPSLKKKHSEFLLRELVERWKNHKVMVRWLIKVFSHVENSYRVLVVRPLLPLKELGTSCFYDLVFNELKTKVATIVIKMIDDERDGQLIDSALVKDVLGIYTEIGRGSLGLYKLYFEEAFYKATASYYSKKAQMWMLEASCSEYMFKAEECLQKEKERVAHYLHSSTEEKLLEHTKLELISRCAEQILNKENSGFKMLLADEKIEDVSRIYNLFAIEDGLSQVLKIFKEHVIEEGMSLLKHVTDAANSKKGKLLYRESYCSEFHCLVTWLTV